MQIRSQQMEVMLNDAERKFVLSTVAHMREHHAAQVSRFPEKELQTRVEAGIKRARGYGLTWESSITGFVALTFVIGPDFDKQPRIQSVLTDRSIPADERVEELRFRVGPRDWAQAAEETPAI